MRRLLLFLVVILFMISITFIPSVAQTTRTVMLEEFTGTWCGWCPYGADILAAILKDHAYARGLSYHRTSGSPPDTMETSEGVTFISAMNPAYPMAAIDRVLWSGQPKIPIGRDLWESKTVERYQATSPISITVGGEYDQYSKVITVNVHLDVLANITGQYNLNVIISEDNISQKQMLYPQSTYIDPYLHKHVVRKMITGAYGKTLTTSGFANGVSRDTTITFTMKSWWKYNSLDISVMVGQMNGTTFQPLAQSFQERMYAVFTTVPVKLITFLAEQDQRGVKLTWRTASESNNLGWQVERRTASSDWSAICFVPGHGTTSQQCMYDCIDENVAVNTEYQYRLKQIDVDGKYEYSTVAHVFTFATPTTYSVAQNYPNPFNPTTTILYSLPVEEQVSIVVFDNLGRKVKTLFDGMQQAGPWEVQWNGTDESGKTVANGLYYYTVTTPNFKTTNRMMLVK